MRRSSRSSDCNSRYATDPLQSKRAKTVASLSLEGISGISNVEGKGEHLLHHCLSSMPPGVWYKIVPSEGEVMSTIEYATNQSWSLLCPLLLYLKYLNIIGNSLKINATKFSQLSACCSETVKLHHGTYRPKGLPMQHYLCYDTPRFGNPSKQANAEKARNYCHASMPYYTRYHSMIENRLIDFISSIKRQSCAYNLLSSQAAVETSVNASGTPAPTDAITPTRTISVIELQIQNAMSLDFCVYPRPKRSVDSTVVIHNRKYASKEEKIIALLACKNWGWDTSGWSTKIRIARAASRLVAYDAGYRLPFGHTNLMRLDDAVKLSLAKGNQSVKEYFCDKRGGKIAFLDFTNKKHPGYVHELYRYASNTLGAKASFFAISLCMNERSQIVSETRDSFNINRRQLNNWFNDNGGKEISPIEKPLDTPIHKVKRLGWVRKYYRILTCPSYYVAYLDEKFFYTTSRRKKIKVLPKGEHEVDGADKFIRPKMRSRRFPIKSMFMGVVGRPIPHREFDGKIMLERVSEEVPITRLGSHTSFTDDAIANAMIRNGEWRILFSPIEHILAIDLISHVCEHYALDEAIGDRMEAFVTTFIGANGNTKEVVLALNSNIFDTHIRTDADKDLPDIPIQINDIKLRVRHLPGDVFERDCSCDSTYMATAMRRVGICMREKYHWVSQDVMLYLVLDNAGGHGTNECVDAYVAMLKEEYNIMCIHQVPRSPFTNVLDLGVWAALQSEVERRHFLKRSDTNALVRTVNDVWREGNMNRVITNVFDRIKRVLNLINEGEGGNDYVETKRGVKFENMKFDYNLNTEHMSNNTGVTEFMIEDEDDDHLPFATV